MGSFNFYITTDFAVSDKQSADFSVISVWAYNNNGDFFWVDGTVKRQTIDKSIEDLFNFNTIYKPVQVGIEVTGQQGGFIDIIQRECMRRNNYINFAKEPGATRFGIKPNTNKLVRFQSVLPWFKLHKFYFPKELEDDPRILEFMEELLLSSPSGFRSKHDDCIDTVSMLSKMSLWKPNTQVTPKVEANNVYKLRYFMEDETSGSNMDSYLV